MWYDGSKFFVYHDGEKKTEVYDQRDLGFYTGIC